MFIFNQAIAVGTLGYAYTTLSHDVISLSGQSQKFWIGGKGYRTANGGIAQYTHVIGPKAALSLSGQYFDIRYQTDPLRNAKRYAGGLTYSDGDFYAVLSGGAEKTNLATSKYLSNNFVSGRIGAEHPFGDKLSLFGSAAVEHRQYQDLDPLFLVKRNDTQFDVSGGLHFRLSKQFLLTPQVGYTHNQSNIALNKYDRVTTSVTFRVQF